MKKINKNIKQSGLKQSGGLKLKNNEKKGFKAIFDMLNKPSCQLDLLTYSSLKGFMITLNISADDSEYLALSGGRFTQPVTSFILKFAVITPNDSESLPQYKGVQKSSETRESYFEEAKLQQSVWLSSISGGRSEICPPVANFSLFDDVNSLRLLEFLVGKTTGKVEEVFNYLLMCVGSNPGLSIGIIVMPNVNMSATFADFIKAPNGTNFYGITINTESKNYAFASISAQIVRLFIDIGVIHFDLHANNALIYKSGDNTIKCLLIDFGRASNIMNDKEDEYLSEVRKDELKKLKNKLYNRIFRLSFSISDDEKRQYILQIMDYLATLDHELNQQLFNMRHSDAYQMDWYEVYPKKSYVPVEAFNILKSSIETMGTSGQPSTLRRYENQGYILNFRGTPDMFLVPFNIPAPAPVFCDDGEISEDGACVISGGKIKSKKRKIIKNRKRKTIRKRK